MSVPTQALQFQVPDLMKIYNGGENFPRYFTFRLIEVCDEVCGGAETPQHFSSYCLTQVVFLG